MLSENIDVVRYRLIWDLLGGIEICCWPYGVALLNHLRSCGKEWYSIRGKPMEMILLGLWMKLHGNRNLVASFAK